MATTEKPVLSKYKERMDKAVAALGDEFASLRTGRANAHLLDQIRVDAYGSQVPINQVGAVSVPEPRMLTVTVWDRGLVVSVEKAIRASDLGLNPVVDGSTLRLPIPPLTEERRKDLAKLAGKYAEQQKVAVRNVRRDANEDCRKAKKDGVIGEDEEKRMEAEVQKITDEAIKRVDEALKTKEQEIMHV
jgi:ribosome recycling factor